MSYDYEEHRKALREMCTVSSHYDFDQDPRYGWVKVDAFDHKGPIDIIIQTGEGTYGYSFKNGVFEPFCTCSARSAGECCCQTGNWEYDDYDY